MAGKERWKAFVMLSLERMETWLQSSDEQKGNGRGEETHLSPPVERTRNPTLNFKKGTFQSNINKNLSKCTDSKSTRQLSDLHCFLQNIHS